MLKTKSCSKNDLMSIYYSCALCQKYYQYNLWFGSFGEYDNIKYCKNYVQKYIYYWIHIFLLQRFSFFFVIFLYKSPSFTKFVESGFFIYLDYHFLLSFYKNCFTFNSKDKQEIKLFVKFYFQSFLKNRLENDLLSLVIKSINEIILIKYLTNRLKKIQIHMKRVWLSDKNSFRLVKRENRKEIYFVGVFSFDDLIKKSYFRQGFTHFENCDQIKFPYESTGSDVTYKSTFEFISLKNNNTLKSRLQQTLISKFRVEKTFLLFPQKILHSPNRDVQYLVESIELLGDLNGQQQNIGLYKNVSVLFIDLSIQKRLLLEKSLKNYKLLKKSFNICFVRHTYKTKFYSKISIRRNLKFFINSPKKTCKNYFFKDKKKTTINPKSLSSGIKKRFIIKYKFFFFNNRMFNNISHNYNSWVLYKEIFLNISKPSKYLFVSD